MNTITSNQNPIIKQIKSLKQRKHREEKKLFFIEGIRFVEEALKESVEIETILISEHFAMSNNSKSFLLQIEAGNYETFTVPDKLFKEISDTDNPQGILAIIKARGYELNDILGNDRPFIIILDSIQDPGNLGTIIRTADAAGVDGIIISKGCVDIYNPKVLRSTMGSIFHIPTYFCNSLIETIDILKGKGIKVFAAHLDGNSDYFATDMSENVAVIIGNEANGISDEVASCSDVLVKIPMPGKAESLNASVAAGLLIYEVLRQRMDM